MASDAADALAKTYARNKKLLSLRSITNSLQQTGLLEACTYRASSNLRIEYRLGALGDAERTRKYASELVALAPDVIFANGTSQVGPLLQATRTVPIIFTAVADPVGAGFVDSLARPGGNATGFVQYEYGLGGKWLELLKEIAPRVTRAAVLRDAAITAGVGLWGAIQTAAPSFGIEVSPVNVRDASEIERTLTVFAHEPNGGLILTGSALSAAHGDLIVALATRHKLPAVYFSRQFVDGGGLISYGPDTVDQFRRAASYVDRILKGEKPGDLPVQVPTKYELVINLKTAEALGLTIPPAVLSSADEGVAALRPLLAQSGHRRAPFCPLPACQFDPLRWLF